MLPPLVSVTVTITVSPTLAVKGTYWLAVSSAATGPLVIPIPRSRIMGNNPRCFIDLFFFSRGI